MTSAHHTKLFQNLNICLRQQWHVTVIILKRSGKSIERKRQNLPTNYADTRILQFIEQYSGGEGLP